MRRLEELSPEEALIVRYICDDNGAVDVNKSYRVLVRALLRSKEIRDNLLLVIANLEAEKEAERKS